MWGVTLIAASAQAANEDCSYFYNLGCTSGDATTNPPEWEERAFQTYLPGTEKWQEGYEGLGRVMCYNNIVYDSGRTSATVEAVCRTHKSIDTTTFNWNGEGYQTDNTYQVDSSFTEKLSLTVTATDSDGVDFTITMEPLNFIF